MPFSSTSVKVYFTLLAPLTKPLTLAVRFTESPTDFSVASAVRLTDVATGVDSNSYFSVPCPSPGVQVNLYLPLVLGVNTISSSKLLVP